MFAKKYSLADYLPGYALVGLRGWDDFIVRDEKNALFTILAVPLTADLLRPFPIEIEPSHIKADSRFTGKIKWYIQPIIFGGDPQAQKNMTWIPIDTHAEAVNYWNKLYRDIKAGVKR